MGVWYVVQNGKIYSEHYTRKEAATMAAALRKMCPRSTVTIERD